MSVPGPLGTGPVATASDTETSLRERVLDYVELTKPRLVLLVLLTTWVGFHVGSTGVPGATFGLLASTLLGTVLAGAGSQVLNQYVERESDARMRRTRERPLPGGRIDPADGLAYGLLLTTTGVVFLWLTVSPLASLLAAATVGTYLLAYTPLKSRTPLSTMIGCIPGALPPLIGWAAARGSLGPEAWSLFAILFFWQVPHSLAIGWLYRSDYERAGTRLLPVVEPDGRSTGRQVLLNCLALHAVALVPAAALAGQVYFALAWVVGLILIAAGVRFARNPDAATGRQVLIASYVYLPILLVTLALDPAGV